jgi:hypothetical protein
MFEERVGLFGSEAVRLQPFHILLDALLTPPLPPDAVHPVEHSLLLRLSFKTTKNRAFPSVSPLQRHTGCSRTSRTRSPSISSRVCRFFFFFLLSFAHKSFFSVCRSVADHMHFSGLTFGDFAGSFDKSLGRTAELTPSQEARFYFLFRFLLIADPPNSQLLASVYMLVGTQFTNHSVRVLVSSFPPPLITVLQGILGAGTVVPSFDTLKHVSDLTPSCSTSIATLRHQPLSSVAQLMLERIDQLDVLGGTADEAAERILLCFMALELLSTDVAAVQHRLFGELAMKGMLLAESTELGEDAAGMLDFALQGLVVRAVPL